MTLLPSPHNIISPVTGGQQFIIVNLLSGNADIISETELEALRDNRSGDYPAEFVQKGYVVNPDEEKLAYRLKYIEFLEERDNEEMQVFFVPTYSCNFTCSYCYQSEYPNPKHEFGPTVTDAFFHFLKKKFADRKKYITLFGGEPLLGSPKHMENISYFISACQKNHLDLAIVTNGYSLHEYLPMLDKSFVREVQITLDGTSEVHNQRRRVKTNKPTFDRIVQNIDACLDKGIPVNLRMVIDRENINNLPQLAKFAIGKGWTALEHFKTQIGRNYELHYCQNGQSILFDRLSLYQEMLTLIREHPHITEFHKPSFSIMRFLQENHRLPNALFDSCPACKSEWAMDFTGSIYSCTATVGKPGEKLGTFYPQISMDEEKIKIWQQRDVQHIEKCRDCNVQLICGGGCGSLAKNQHGSILSPDCRPIEQLIGLGANAYFS